MDGVVEAQPRAVDERRSRPGVKVGSYLRGTAARPPRQQLASPLILDDLGRDKIRGRQAMSFATPGKEPRSRRCEWSGEPHGPIGRRLRYRS